MCQDQQHHFFACLLPGVLQLTHRPEVCFLRYVSILPSADEIPALGVGVASKTDPVETAVSTPQATGKPKISNGGPQAASATACTPLMDREAAASAELAERMRRKGVQKLVTENTRLVQKATSHGSSIFKNVPRSAVGQTSDDSSSSSDDDDDIDLSILVRRRGLALGRKSKASSGVDTIRAVSTSPPPAKRARVGLAKVAAALRKSISSKSQTATTSTTGWNARETIAPAKNGSYEYGY